MKSKLSSRADVGIFGAGIMGCCLALELAQGGLQIDLIDQASAPMLGASLHNEGKLHLGYVYAKDPTRTTHSIMLRGSLAFYGILERLTGCKPEDLKPSYPFYYYVPDDSQLSINEIEEYFLTIEQEIHDEIESSGNLYLNKEIKRFSYRNSLEEQSRLFSSDAVVGSFFTEEVSVSPASVAEIISRAVLREPNIRFVNNAEIIAAEFAAGEEIKVDIRNKRANFYLTYPCVVNCLWDGKWQIDQSIGINDQGPWISRYKATINLSVKSATKNLIPSATGILGSYGDVVNHGNGRYYLSWYPLCKMGQSVNEDGRLLHELVHQHSFPRWLQQATSAHSRMSKSIGSIVHRRFLKDNITALAQYIPGLNDLLSKMVDFEIGGGVILAKGSTDIDDPDSYLHKRAEIGPAAYQNYLTIDTGKYCTAPYFAVKAARMIMEILA